MLANRSSLSGTHEIRGSGHGWGTSTVFLFSSSSSTWSSGGDLSEHWLVFLFNLRLRFHVTAAVLAARSSFGASFFRNLAVKTKARMEPKI